MTTQDYESETATVSHEGVTVTREIVSREHGIAGTVEIRSDRDDPVFVHVVDTFPPELAVEEAAFEPGSEPDIGEVSPERVAVRQNVGDRPARIRYGLFPAEPVTGARWDPPTIRSVTDVAAARSFEGYRGSDDERTRDVPDRLRSRLERLFRDSTFPTAERDRPETAANGTDEGAADTGERAADTDDGIPAGDGRRRDDGRKHSSEPARADADADRPEPAENSTGRFGSARRRRGAERGSVPRSVKLRIDRLSARVEEVSAYTSALEGLIDEYGTGPEIIGGIEDDLDDIDDRLDVLADEMGSVREEHDEDIDEVRAAVGRVDDELDRVDRAVEDAGSDVEAVERDVSGLESRFDDLEDDVRTLRDTVDAVREDVAAVSDDVAALREEVDGMCGEVEELRSFRKSLAEISHVDAE